MIETLPCIRNKCILYPVCKYKKYIDCEHLRDYFKQAKILKHSHRRTWEELNKHLPNTLSIKKHSDLVATISHNYAKMKFRRFG